MADYKYTVFTLCATYNHSPYVENALQGFTIQEVSFPVVCVVIDDASTDGEQELLKKWANNSLLLSEEGVAYDKYMDYGEVLYARHKDKFNMFFVIILLKENHYSQKKIKRPYYKEWLEQSKYFASCEGDDYWTDCLKLQKQVDFLENNPQYIFCVHNFKRYVEKEDKFIEGYRYNEDFSFDVENYLKYWPTQPLTALTRISAEPSADTIKLYQLYRDNHRFYLLLKQGLGYYMADVMGVYRMTNKGIWTSLNWIEKIKIDLDCFVELHVKNNDDKILRNYCISSYAYYLYCCRVNHIAPKYYNRNVFGFWGTLIIYFRLLFYFFYGFIKPSIKQKK